MDLEADDGFERWHEGRLCHGVAVEFAITCLKIVTTPASNWVPAQRSSSITACRALTALRKTRGRVIASKASATAMMRAPRATSDAGLPLG